MKFVVSMTKMLIDVVTNSPPFCSGKPGHCWFCLLPLTLVVVIVLCVTGLTQPALYGVYWVL